MEHMKDVHYEKEEEFNCEECDFQTNGSIHLRKHIEIKHEMKCKLCDNRFSLDGPQEITAPRGYCTM